MQDYLDGSPHLEKVKDKLLWYEQLMDEINKEPNWVAFIPFAANTCE